MSKINETNYPRRTQANYADTDMLVIQAAGGNTYTTRLEDMREDYEETLAPTLSALQDDINENLATIEAGSTASQAYAKGDFLVFGGRLCKAKTSIAVNATLVLDTNIELASVGGELSSISSDLASLRSNVNLLKVVWVDFTAMTSANGNVSLTSIINTELNLPIAVSAHYKSNPSLMVACMLYQYTSSRPNLISGFRCFSESAQTEPILNTEIEGRIYALKIAPF